MCATDRWSLFCGIVPFLNWSSVDVKSMLFPMSTLVGLGRGCRLRLSEAWWGLVMLNRTDSLTHKDCGDQDMVTIAELCVNRIESYTTGLSGYKYSTVVVDCNFGVQTFLMRAFALTYRVPFLGYNRSLRLYESTWNILNNLLKLYDLQLILWTSWIRCWM